MSNFKKYFAIYEGGFACLILTGHTSYVQAMYHWFLYLFSIIFKSGISTYFINLMHNNVTLLKI